ncbi:MAG: dodecin family protein [Acidimicrobiia bacterium]
MADDVTGGVVKVIELVGSSAESFDDAVRTAVRGAARTIRNIRGVEVVSWSATVDGDAITNYKADCKIAFLVDAAG